MTIGGIGGGGAGALGLEGQLALLVLTSEDAQQAADREQAALERDRFVAAADKEVAELHEAADHTWEGALIRGIGQAASAGIQLYDATHEPPIAKPGETQETEKPYGEIGAAAAKVGGELVAAFVGDSAVQDDKADARRAETNGQLAQSDLGEARDALHQSQGRTEKTLDWLTSVSSNQASADTAIIAGFA